MLSTRSTGLVSITIVLLALLIAPAPLLPPKSLVAGQQRGTGVANAATSSEAAAKANAATIETQF